MDAGQEVCVSLPARDGWAWGTLARGTIVQVFDFGVFVDLDDGRLGFVVVPYLSHSTDRISAHDLVRVGDRVTGVILMVDEHHNPPQVRLSLRALMLSPE